MLTFCDFLRLTLCEFDFLSFDFLSFDLLSVDFSSFDFLSFDFCPVTVSGGRAVHSVQYSGRRLSTETAAPPAGPYIAAARRWRRLEFLELVLYPRLGLMLVHRVNYIHYYVLHFSKCDGTCS